MTRLIIVTAVLTLVYALALASADPWDLGLGALLGLGVSIGFRDFLFTTVAPPAAEVIRRIAGLPRLALATFVDIVRGTFIVARAVLTPGLPRHDGFVVIPNGNRSPTGVAVNGLLSTLSPGSVLIEIDPETETWTIHALDASDEEALVEEVQRFYERYQRPVWP